MALVLYTLFLLVALWTIVGIVRQKVKAGDRYSAMICILIGLDAYLALAICVAFLYLGNCHRILLPLWCTAIGLLIPLIYMYIGPRCGDKKVGFTLIFSLACMSLLLLPKMGIEMGPTLSGRYEPARRMGLSFYYQGKMVYHMKWLLVVVVLQGFATLIRFVRCHRKVLRLGGGYSWKAACVFAAFFIGNVMVTVAAAVSPYRLQTPVGLVSFFLCAALAFWLCWYMSKHNYAAATIVCDDTAREVSDFLFEKSEKFQLLRRVMEEEQCYLEPGIQSEDICHRLDVKREMLVRMMKRAYGMSFVEYINSARIHTAQELMMTSEMDLLHIARASGYVTAEELQKVFKKVTGQTPAEWYREQRNQSATEPAQKVASDQ